MKEIVKVSGLRVTARNDMGEEFPIVHGADFSIQKGEVVALIGAFAALGGNNGALWGAMTNKAAPTLDGAAT